MAEDLIPPAEAAPRRAFNPMWLALAALVLLAGYFMWQRAEKRERRSHRTAGR